MNNRKIEIFTTLRALIEEPVVDIGRAGNMIWITFGSPIEVTTLNGKKRIIGKYSVHIQCPWRITLNHNIITASGDLYKPRPGMSDLNFNWDSLGSNLFDSIVDQFRVRITSSPILVTNISVDSLGGFAIDSNNGYRLEVFIDCSSMQEFWRFFDNSNNEDHLVVFDNY
jgi:hypothetical protein